MLLVVLAAGLMACQPTPTRTLGAAWATFTPTRVPTTPGPPTDTPLPPPSPTLTAFPTVAVVPSWTPYVPAAGYPPTPTALWYPPTPVPWVYPPTPTPLAYPPPVATPWVYPPTPTPWAYPPVATPWVYPPTPTPLWYPPVATPWVYPPTPTPWTYPPVATPWIYPPTPTPAWYYVTPTPLAYPPTWTPLPPTSTPLPPVVTVSVNPPTTQLLVGQSVALTADAAGQGLTFQWSAARGTLSAYNAPAVIYTAPASPGPDTVTVAVTGGGGTTYRSLSFTITSPTPVAPTPLPPPPGGTPTPAVIIVTPTSAPVGPVPPGGGAPEATLIAYYDAINALDYVRAWSLLTPRFKRAWHCCTPDGDFDFASFVRWWERVAQVSLQNVAISGPVADTALVYADVTYRRPDGTEVADPYAYHLLARDAATGAWQLTARGLDAAIADSPPPPAPDEAVRAYYAAAAARLYHIAWAALSPAYKQAAHCCTPEGDFDFAGYADWWDGVMQVELSGVRIVEQTDTSATVYADLAYLKQDGSWLFEPQSAIRLALDPDVPAWRIEARTTAEGPPGTPPSFSEPVEVVRRYYAAVSARNYGLSWPMLSPHFKQKFHCCTADGGFDLAGYAEWWDSIQRVDVGHVELIDRQGNRATVYAELAYTLRDGRQTLDPAGYIQLQLDPATGEWLFWDKGETP